MASIWLALRRFRDGRAAVLGLVVLVLVTSVCAALAPRVFDRFADDALRGEVRQATPFQRNIQLIEETAIDPAGELDPMEGVAAKGEQLEAQMPAARAGAVPRPELFRGDDPLVRPRGHRGPGLRPTPDPAERPRPRSLRRRPAADRT